ncbi:MAG TPA: DUF924 family protein [Steroidobacteraceae bacterium]|nr:DUF924 family protein [Steroidobacteraceae bacterium]
MPIAEAEAVLEFWFPRDMQETHQAMARQLEWWFRAGADADICERFTALTERAERGELDHWSRDAHSRLALLLVLDQFPRSLYRGTARAYAQDAKAQKLTLEGLTLGHYAALATPWEKTFFLMPLGHSEELAHLDRAVELATELAATAPESIRGILEHSASQARGHREVVARFGRQPHRNAVLGRSSTPEELDYLARGQFVHQRSVPSERASKP